MLTGDMTDRNRATTGRVSDEGVEQEEMRGQDKRNIGKDFTGRRTGALINPSGCPSIYDEIQKKS